MFGGAKLEEGEPRTLGLEFLHLDSSLSNCRSFNTIASAMINVETRVSQDQRIEVIHVSDIQYQSQTVTYTHISV